MIAAALLGALSDRFRGDRIHAIESFGIDGTPSTKTAVNFLTNVVSSKNVLVVIERNDDVTLKSIRNLSNLHVLTFDQLNAYDVLVSDDIVFTQAALEGFIASKSRRQPGGLRMSEQASVLQTALNKDPRDIILKPVVSEKSYGLIDEGKYTFLVDPRASKTEIKLAIEKIFGVKVAGVNTLNRVGKARRTRFGTGKRKDTKRAIVTLKSGTIDIFTAIG